MYAGKYEEALQLLDTAYALAPNSKKLFAKATVYTQVGRFGEALQFIRTMPRIEANPDILARGRKLEQTILAECAKQNLRCE